MAAPVRMCRVCRRRAPKGELARWVQTPQGAVADPHQRLGGRGFYTCSKVCAAKLSKIKPNR